MAATERLARSGSYSLIGSSFAAIAALALAVLVGNGFGATGTGLFFQALALFTIASQVLRLGTNSAIVKSISEQRAFGRTGEAWRTMFIAVTPVIVLSLMAAVVMSIFSDELASWLGSPGQERELARLLRDLAPFVVAASVFAVLTTGMRMMRGVVSFTLVQSIFLPASRLLAIAAAIALSLDYAGAFLAWMAVVPLWLVVSIAILVRPLLLDWRQRRRAAENWGGATKRFWSFSGSRAVGGTLEILLEWSDVIIVAALASPAAAGVYAVATRAVRAGQVVDRAMRLAVSPTISQMLALSDVAAARDLHTSVTRALILTTWPFYLLLATMGPAVLSVFGPGFEAGAVVLTILAITMMIASASGMLQSVLLQGGRSSWQVYNKSFVLALSIGSNLLLIPLLGILGAAITWSVCVLVDTAIASWQVHRRMGVQLEPRKLILAMTTAVTVFGAGGLIIRVSFGPSIPALLIGFSVLALIYLASLWLLRYRLGIVSLWREVPLIGRHAARSASPHGSHRGAKKPA